MGVPSIFSLLLIVAVTLYSGPSFSEGNSGNEVFQISGNWEGRFVQREGESKYFCGIENSIKDRGFMIMLASLGKNRSGTSLIILNKDWDLNKGANHSVGIFIDENKVAQKKAISQKNSFTTTFPGKSGFDFLDKIKKGEVLTLKVGGNNMRFSIEGSLAAVQALKQCYYQHSGGNENTDNPFE